MVGGLIVGSLQESVGELVVESSWKLVGLEVRGRFI